jgi:hypothetical protein
VPGLRDTEDKPLATNESSDSYTNIDMKRQLHLVTKFPAPPADV